MATLQVYKPEYWGTMGTQAYLDNSMKIMKRDPAIFLKMHEGGIQSLDKLDKYLIYFVERDNLILEYSVKV